MGTTSTDGRRSQVTSRLVVLFALFGCLLSRPCDAAVRIQDDMGGSLGTYYMKYTTIRKSGQQVIIDGDCFSACTIVTGMVARQNICVTPRARFGFHAALAPNQYGMLAINQ